LSALLEGIIAGYGVAIPVGQIAVLIIDTALRGGFKPGFAAGAGAATADLIYALTAALAGAALAGLIGPYETPLRFISAAILIALGGWGLWKLRAARKPEGEAKPVEVIGVLPTYIKFVGLTLINPLTIVTFAALILGNPSQALESVEGKILFVVGAAFSSLSWQTLLAALGAIAHRALPPGAQLLTRVIGNLVVIGLGVRILVLVSMGG
jgi:threonine/homoserine/homoserine lactone efflux protein